MNLVTATVDNPKLWILAFQDVPFSMRSVMVSAALDMIDNYSINGSCENKYRLFN